MLPGRPLRASLGAVLRARLLARADAAGIEGRPDDLVPEARQVLDAAAADEHDRVLLEVVPLTGDVGADLHAVRQADTRDLAESRVRLLRGGRVDARADAALLRRAAERGGLGLRLRGLPTLPHELVDGGHELRFVLGRFAVTQQRSARPQGLPTGRGMVAKARDARQTA